MSIPHVGLAKVWTIARRYKVLTLLFGVGMIWGYVVWADNPVQVSRTTTPKPLTLPPLQTGKALQAKDWLDIQQRTVEQDREMKDLKRMLSELGQEQDQERRERAQREAQQSQQFETKLHQALDAQASKLAALQQPKASPVRPQVAKAAPVPPQPVTLPAKPMANLEILKNDDKDWTAGAAALPEEARAETAYIPAGSFAESKLVSGVFATSRRGGALPVLLTVAQSFHGPYQLHGPERRPEVTTLQLEGCFLLGKAEADLSSSRVNMTVDLLSCVFPDRATFEKPVKGYVVGEDGTLGMLGRLETRDTAYLARTFLVSLMSGAAEAFALSKRTVVITPFGGTTTTVTDNVGEYAGYSALARATADLSKFYLEQAERLMPVLWVESGMRGKVIFQEGLSLDDYPTKVLISQGEK